MGDFNYPKINCDTLDCNPSSAAFKDFLRDSTRDHNILDFVISFTECRGVPNVKFARL